MKKINNLKEGNYNSKSIHSKNKNESRNINNKLNYFTIKESPNRNPMNKREINKNNFSSEQKFLKKNIKEKEGKIDFSNNNNSLNTSTVGLFENINCKIDDNFSERKGKKIKEKLMNKDYLDNSPKINSIHAKDMNNNLNKFLFDPKIKVNSSENFDNKSSNSAMRISNKSDLNVFLKGKY